MSIGAQDKRTHAMCDLGYPIDRLQRYDSSLTELQKRFHSQTLYVELLEHDLDSHKDALIENLKQIEGYKMTLRTLEADFSRLHAEVQEKDRVLNYLQNCHDHTQCFQSPMEVNSKKRKHAVISKD